MDIKGCQKPFEEITIEEWEKVMAVNLTGTVMFLASEQSDCMTGQSIYTNGGIYFH